MSISSLVAPLFVPANRPERFAKAAASGADAVIIDLEDAVSPNQKDAARANLASIGALPVPAFVRINAISTPWFTSDLDALRTSGCRTVCLPKVESPELVEQVLAVLGRDITILAQIETAKGLQNAAAIAAHPNILQLAFGPADFFLDMDVAVSKELTAFSLASLAVASRAAGKQLPLDGPAFAINDADALAQECALAVSLGAAGKLCIHPNQVAPVLKSFRPSEKDVDWARRIIAADNAGAAQIVEGQMIDAPIVARARSILSRAAA
ncbi:HpcH/HpaI aldolase/citrate lyase family protein [Mesorhizobium denitrificans]|uniref:CoA ester lyase n=1 Tax=Mesorhizobium denitrificans TaxID=2294114 RepID=A0A371XBJ5_9HYPH|nr:CoA ester lyase [Mesorhizobium denitrificans]RFC66590.1 CoA ester lyase [Mesorhizobium denitrificans]